VLDPACGSGAFPMGILQKLVHVLRKLDDNPPNALWKAQNRTPLEQQLAIAKKLPDPTLRDEQLAQALAALDKFDQDFADPDYADYARKLYLIEKCLYGVDIQPVAVQIAKLRFFVSLVVEQKLDAARNRLTPLPNLETKIVAANTLLPIPRSNRQADLLSDPAVAEKEAELREANASHFAAKRFADKRKRKARILHLRDELAALLKADLLLSPGDAERMTAWDPFDQNRSRRLFRPRMDVRFLAGLRRADWQPALRAARSHQGRQATLQAALRLLQRHGRFVRVLLRALVPVAQPLWGIELHHQQQMVSRQIWRRPAPLHGHTHRDAPDHRLWRRGGIRRAGLSHHRHRHQAGQAGRTERCKQRSIGLELGQQQPGTPGSSTFPRYSPPSALPCRKSELKAGGWQLEQPAKRRLLERLRKAGQPLGDLAGSDIYRGITSGFNDAYVVDRETRDRLIADSPSAAHLFEQYLRGRDINRWRPTPSDLFLIRIESSENVTHPWSGEVAKEAEKTFASTYPSIHGHLSRYRNELVDRYDQGKYFWELRSCKYWENFKFPKILSTKISIQPTFALDTSGSTMANTAYFFNVHNEDEYLLAILNSGVSSYYARCTFVQKQGGYYEVQPDALKAFCIPSCSSTERALLTKLTTAVQGGPAAPEYERLLNGLVYELFFPEELHAKGIHLFDACAEAGIADWPTSDETASKKKPATVAKLGSNMRASTTAAEIFQPSHPIYGMLFELQAVEVVRIIEGVA
jgi:adenine-specific DNA-methyltransferase